MHHEHLTETEIQDLLDSQHAEDRPVELSRRRDECPQCAVNVRALQEVTDALAALPHFEPSPRFAAAVLARVHVFEPLHITVFNAFARLLPESGVARGALAASLALSGMILTGGVLWLVSRLDVLFFAGGVALERVQTAVLAGVQSLALGVVGVPTAEYLGLHGARSVWFATALLGVSGVLATAALHYTAAVARRRR